MIDVEWGTGLELLVAVDALHASPDDRATYGLRDVLETALRFAPASLREAPPLPGPACKALCALAGLLADLPDSGDPDVAIARLEDADPLAVYAALIIAATPADRRDEVSTSLAAGAAVDAAERTRLGRILTAALAASDDAQATVDSALARLATLDPTELQERVVATLRGWRRVLAPHLTAVAPILAAEGDAIRRRVDGLETTDAVEAATGGIRWTPSPSTTSILIVPQATMSPWVVISETGDQRVFFVAVRGIQDPTAPSRPPEELVASLRALGEEQRLRILRRLGAGPASLGALAEHLGVAKSTAHHHMVQLRAAGFVVVELGAESEYRLRPGARAALAESLDAWLDTGPPALRRRNREDAP